MAATKGRSKRCYTCSSENSFEGGEWHGVEHGTFAGVGQLGEERPNQ
jgi:hypothetical protein